MEHIEYTGRRIALASTRSFDDVCSAFERVVGRTDLAVLTAQLTREEILATIPETLGPSGFTVFQVIEHGLLVSVLGLRSLKARVYLVGNPLIAAEMTSEEPIVGLYVPLRLLVYEADGRTLITYDQPSSLLSQVRNETIMHTARMLDDKLLSVVTEIATP